ncbi:unannotated protein [freshwater metagenome]|uniref:Unannotated protein n=1 Tax=freshwater metagenome TaxID=449393 RepID=A0A6J6PPH9_9ZZZZ
MRPWVAEIHGKRLAAVAIDDAVDAAVNLLPRLVPLDLDMHAVALHQGLANAIWVFV